MRNMLAFAAFVVIAVGGVGFYLDWFNIRSTPAPNGQRSFTLDVNTDKIGEDVRHLEEKAQQKISEKQDKGQQKLSETKEHLKQKVSETHEHVKHKKHEVSAPGRMPKVDLHDVHDVLRDR